MFRIYNLAPRAIDDDGDGEGDNDGDGEGDGAGAGDGAAGGGGGGVCWGFDPGVECACCMTVKGKQPLRYVFRHPAGSRA